MRREAVDSETIASISYEPRRRELDLEFCESGDIYRYFQVSAEEHNEFLLAESKGSYLNRVFKGKGALAQAVKRGCK